MAAWFQYPPLHLPSRLLAVSMLDPGMHQLIDSSLCSADLQCCLAITQLQGWLNIMCNNLGCLMGCCVLLWFPASSSKPAWDFVYRPKLTPKQLQGWLNTMCDNLGCLMGCCVVPWFPASSSSQLGTLSIGPNSHAKTLQGWVGAGARGCCHAEDARGSAAAAGCSPGQPKLQGKRALRTKVHSAYIMKLSVCCSANSPKSRTNENVY